VLDLSPEQARAVARRLSEACEVPSYPYPWDGLEEDLARVGDGSLRLLGYGSLVNSISAARTLTTGVREPIIAVGARRIFNYEMPGPTSRYGPPAHPNARALLNLRVTGRLQDMVNGVLIETPPSDIPALRSREVGYDLVAVACINWHRREEPPSLAYTFQRYDESEEGRAAEDTSIEPHDEYYRVCRQGAAEYGDDFLRFWLATTYLADGTTLVQEWDARHF
jgi:hypothetical protein